MGGTAGEGLPRLFMSWLAGLVDSDGSINVVDGGGYARLSLTVHNNDRALLDALKHALETLGYHPAGPYQTFSEGDVTRHGIRYRSDMWSLQMERKSEVQRLLRELPIRLNEKIYRKEIALSVQPATKWSDLEIRVLTLRQKIHSEVEEFLEQAKQQYLITHAAKSGRNRARQMG